MGTKNVQHLLLAESKNIMLYLLHNKWGLIKNCVRVMDQIGPAFRYPAEKFPGTSATKIQGECFRRFTDMHAIRGEQYDSILSGNDKTAVSDSRLEETNFLGNNKADNRNTLAENALLFYQKLHCNVFQEAFHELSL